MYAFIKQDSTIDYSPYIKWFPDISFPDCGPSLDWMQLNKVYVVNEIPPKFDDSLNTFSWTEPYYDETLDEFRIFKIIKKTQTELDNEAKIQILQGWHILRKSRNDLLNDVDSSIIIRYLEQGNPVPNEWLAYKQTLRNLPSTTTDPYNVNWPARPDHPFNSVQVI